MRKYVVSQIGTLKEMEFLRRILSLRKYDADLGQNTLSSQIITKSIICIDIKKSFKFVFKNMCFNFFYFSIFFSFINTSIHTYLYSNKEGVRSLSRDLLNAPQIHCCCILSGSLIYLLYMTGAAEM